MYTVTTIISAIDQTPSSAFTQDLFVELFVVVEPFLLATFSSWRKKSLMRQRKTTRRRKGRGGLAQGGGAGGGSGDDFSLLSPRFSSVPTPSSPSRSSSRSRSSPPSSPPVSPKTSPRPSDTELVQKQSGAL
eukprot:TRINITY_DN804_c0_g2_i3.p2 TRINITY_DN804_c0_g2~~TRINITY_DN804_c0_g2_i3.p2  ORF type:complete len:132 (+),score=40.71 TRINITY_DN804_c0_g2_i3:173-568(+)